MMLRDIMMPEIDRYEVCRQLQADERTCDIPIIFLAARHEASDEQLEQPLELEQMKTDKLMLDILPRSITERLERGEKNISGSYAEATTLFSDLVSFTELCAEMALGMFEDLDNFNKIHGKNVGMRVGLNSGPVVADVIGLTQFSYDLWGNTVNTASRMESTAPMGKTRVSTSTYELLKDGFTPQEDGLQARKGLGQVMTYRLRGRSSHREGAEHAG